MHVASRDTYSMCLHTCCTWLVQACPYDCSLDWLPFQNHKLDVFSLHGSLWQSMGLQPRELRLVGGGSKNRLWRQIVADAFQLPVRYAGCSRPLHCKLLVNINMHNVVSIFDIIAWCRLPAEAESAALGAALQAGAVFSGMTVQAFVEAHPPPLAKEVVLPNPANAAAYEEALSRLEMVGSTLFEPKQK